MDVLKVSDTIKPILGPTPFQTIATLEGLTVREKDGRRTFKTRLGDKNYFVKHHRGVGWKEITKELTQLRLPIISAYNEYKALNILQQLGIHTTNPVAIGVRGMNPASQESFLVTEAIEDTITLKDLTNRWRTQPPTIAFKRALIKEIARIARTLHGNGINHRDFYLCHFRINAETARKQECENLKLYLMDLHRAQMRNKVPLRWLIKDLGALLFSAAHIGLTRSDMFRFLADYCGRAPSQELRENAVFWKAVFKRANKFHLRDRKQPMPSVFNKRDTDKLAYPRPVLATNLPRRLHRQRRISVARLSFRRMAFWG